MILKVRIWYLNVLYVYMSRNFTKGCWNRNMKVLYILPNHRGVLLKIRKQIPWSNIRTFQTFLEHFPRDVFTLQNFTLKVYPINCLLPAFLFATKSTENLKTQFLHLFLLLLKSEIRSMFFSGLPNGIIVYHIMSSYI